MKPNLKIFSFLVAFLFCANLLASGFNFYMAAGPNFVIPTTVRVGWNRWEFGLLSRDLIGANKTFVSSNSAVYSGFALGLNPGVSTNLGFQASVGVHYNWFWGIGFRAEMIANANLNATATSYGLVGVSYGF